jgi:putative flippase GtrA
MSLVIYFLVGGISFLANFAAFVAAQLIGLPWVLGNLLGFVAGTLLNYVLSATFVFRSAFFDTKRTEIVLVFIISAVGLAIETFMITVGYDVLRFQLYAVKIFAAGITFFWNYQARRFLVFGDVKRIPQLS